MKFLLSALLACLIAIVICVRKSFQEDKYFLALAALFLVLAVFFGILVLTILILRP